MTSSPKESNWQSETTNKGRVAAWREEVKNCLRSLFLEKAIDSKELTSSFNDQVTALVDEVQAKVVKIANIPGAIMTPYDFNRIQEEVLDLWLANQAME